MCRPHACNGFTCLCDVGYIVSLDSFSCIRASRVGESCHPKETRCISPFSGCLETCRCYDAFVPTPHGRCRLASASFVGEPCGTMGCEYPAKCIAGTCKCMPPFRSMSEEEFWVDPLVTIQCQREDFSLWKCNGTLIDIPEEMRTTTSTTNEPSTAEMTTETTPLTTKLTTTTEVMTTTTTETSTTDIPTTSMSLTTTSSLGTTSELTTTTGRMKVNIFDPCTRHEECPDNSRCRPNACEGFVCVCNEEYLKSADNTQCMIASRVGDQCDDQTRCMSPFAGCQSTCKCYDLFVPSKDGRCKLWSSAFVGEPCGEKGCEFPAKCYEGICRCVAPFRKMLTEEFWVNPLETSQCHNTNFSLIMCNGRYIDVPEPLVHEWQQLLEAKRLAEMGTRPSHETTTEIISTTQYQTTTQTTMSWLQTGSDVIGTNLNSNPNSRKLYTSCTSHSQCPTSSRCRPNACDGFVCLCGAHYTSSEDNSFCFHAVKVGNVCNKNTDKCLSPFANCVGTCQCYSPFIPTDDGRCRHSMAAFVGESCGGRVGCEYPATCEEGLCSCLTPQRRLTEEEAWIYPLQTKQCQETSFSTMLCDGNLIDVPEELLPEWEDYIIAYRSQFGTTTPPFNTSTTIEATPPSTIDTRTTLTTTAGYISDLAEPCSTHGQCPTNSRCRPKECDGYVCICNRGYIAADDMKTCLKAIRVGEKCHQDVSRCVSPFAGCAGVCRCYDPFIPSYDGRCKVKTANFIGENCGSKGCDHPGSCVSGTCQCRTPYRKKTAEEFWSDPLATSLCSRERQCNGIPIDVPDGLVEDTFYGKYTTYWPDEKEWSVGKNNTGLSNPDSNLFPWKLFTTPPSTEFDGMGDGSHRLGNGISNDTSWWNTGNESGHSFMNREDWRKQYERGPEGSDEYPGLYPLGTNKGLEMANILGRCFTHAQCPEHSYCGPMACDGYVCLCNPGYVPSDNRATCLAAVLVGDVCNTIDSNCLSPFADCDGTCACYDVFETSQDGRCKTKTAGFISDICGGNVGCEFPATCVDGICECADPYRRLTRKEFWADVTRTRQCHRKDFALYLCNGKPVKVPYALRNETDAFGRRLDGFGDMPLGTNGGKGGPNDGTAGLTGGVNGGYVNSIDGTAHSAGSTTGLVNSGGGSNGTPRDSQNGESGSADGANTSGNRTRGSADGVNTSGNRTSGSADGANTSGNRTSGSADGANTSGNRTRGSGNGVNGSKDGGGGSNNGSKGSEVGAGGSHDVAGGSAGGIGTDGSGNGTFGLGDGTGSSDTGTASTGGLGTGTGTDDSNARPGGDRFPDTGGLYYYIPQGGFFVRDLAPINADKSYTITLSDLQKDNRDLLDIHASIYDMPANSNGSGHYIDPDVVRQSGFDPNSTGGGLQPSYTSPSYTNSLGVFQVDRTETLDMDQVRGVISSILPDVSRHKTDGTTFNTVIVSTSHGDLNSQGDNNQYGRKEFNHNKDQSGDKDVNKTRIETPGQNPDVDEANISETILMSGCIAAVFLLNMVCIVLLITNRRRKKRKKEEKARHKLQERSTVSEYEVYQLACPYVTLSSGPYVTITSGPCVAMPTVPDISSQESDKSSSACVTSSSGIESGYSTLPETSTDSVVDSHGNLFDSLRIPRPRVQKGIYNIFGDTDVTSSITTTPSMTSRKRSSTMTYTTAKDSDIKYWFCEIPRPIVSFAKLKNNVSWGTWPKSESNPYIDSVASSTGNHTYEEIMPSDRSDTSV